MNEVVKTDTVPNDAGALMAVISKAATDPTVDVEKMERLFTLYEKMDAQRVEREFNAAMKAVQAEIPAIFKNKKADKHRYADLEAVLDVIAPIYTKHGFSLSFGNEDSPIEKCYRIVCHVSHEAGHTRKYQADLPMDVSGSKNATQGFGSTVAYGRRYLQLMIFNVATTDDNDGAGGGGEGISHEQIAKLESLIAQTGASKTKFLDYMKVESLADIPAAKFNQARNTLEARKAKQ